MAKIQIYVKLPMNDCGRLISLSPIRCDPMTFEGAGRCQLANSTWSGVC